MSAQRTVALRTAALRAVALHSGRFRGLTFLGPCLLLGFCLSACSINPKVDLSNISGSTAPVLLDVPFFPQTEYQCGPAALATVLTAAGAHINPGQLAPQIYLPERQGSLQLELLAATRRAERIPYVIDGDLKALFMEIEQGRPVLVLQNLQTRHFPRWHYAVLSGFDISSGQVYLNTGVSEQLAMDVEKFARLWDWAGNWAMVVLRPGEIPATAEPGPFFESMVNFESVTGSSAAAPAWRAAALKWPNEPQPYLALGNQLYASGDLDQATVLYRQGLKLDGNDVALANNLASVLGELGCPQQGEELLLPVAAALTEDSGWYKIVSSTLAELSALTSTADSKSMKECANRTQQ